MTYRYALSTFDRQHPTTVRLPTELKLRGKAQAASEGKTFTEVMTMALERYLDGVRLSRGKNPSGVDAHYMEKKLKAIISVLDCATPHELTRMLLNLAEVASREIDPKSE